MAEFSLLRSLLPSWRLFDQVGTPLIPLFRAGKGPDLRCPWQNLHYPVAAKPWSLFFNPEVNLHHALQSLTERFTLDAQEFAARESSPKAVTTPVSAGSQAAPLHTARTPAQAAKPLGFDHDVSYQLMLNWSKRRARQADPAHRFVQFRVCARMPETTSGVRSASLTELITSLVHDV